MMKRVSWVCLSVFLFAGTACAQINGRHSLPTAVFLDRPDSALAPAEDAADVVAGPPAFVAEPDPDPLPPPQGVYGVLPKGDREISVGYTFMRFYEVPGVTENANGGYASAVYYLKPWVGAEGEIFAAFGTISGSSSNVLLAALGPRLRWPNSGRVELWGHALVGVANLWPQTAYGKSTAFGYEAGGGVDVSVGRGRWAYRVEGDAVGTRFFSTYQIGPKVSAGIVYKF
ncbi:MAG TPA: hypothetical protein VKS44_16860 [Candidatus Acidoferrales bacterium]|nr:hypothetical protein [Candidatus Acidoferrales bacterium]